MHPAHNRQVVLIVILFWTIINLIQGSVVELIHDEAYYWLYAQNLAWGYFHQPPGVAIPIYLTESLLYGELGVRILFIVLSSFSVYFTWLCVNRSNSITFFAIIFAVAIVHLGFLAVPETIFIFFISLYFFLLKQYLNKDSIVVAVLLGISVAGMSYCKYQALVPLVFTFLPNWRIVKRSSFWIIPLIATIIYLPHLIWLFENDFPPVKFHLRDRADEPYTILFVFQYLGAQLLLFGPMMAVLFGIAFWKYKPKSAFEVTCRWTIIGVFGFFFLLSFRGRVEANWTSAMLIPLIVILLNWIEDRPSLVRLTRMVGVVSVLLLLSARVYVSSNENLLTNHPRNEFHGWKEWSMAISNKAGNLPVVFSNSYQRPSKYMFYTGKFAHSINSIGYNGSQFDLMYESEEAIQGDSVLYISNWIGAKDTIFTKSHGLVTYEIEPDFRTYNRVKISLPAARYYVKPGEEISIEAEISNPTNRDILFSDLDGSLPIIEYHIFEYRHYVSDGLAIGEFPFKELKIGEVKKCNLKLTAPNNEGEFRFRFGIRADYFAGRNSDFSRLIVTE